MTARLVVADLGAEGQQGHHLVGSALDQGPLVARAHHPGDPA